MADSSGGLTPASHACPACGTELGRGLLACPSCRRLVHADQLAYLAREAQRLDAEGDVEGAIALWRKALQLLPDGAGQRKEIGDRIEALVARPRPKGAPAPTVEKPKHPWWKAWPLAVLGLVLKGKSLLFLLVTKGKFLLLGLSKGGTLLTMLAYIGLLGPSMGWKVVVEFVLGMYIHEMGHVAELLRRGFPASAPMFVPGLGAFVRLHMRPASVIEDARIGLAGPIWGLGAALLAFAAWLAWHDPVQLAVTKLTALINLFNLLPVWQLDGSRGFASLTRTQRIVVASAFAVAMFLTHEPMLLIIAGIAAWRAFTMKPAEKPDWICLAQFLVLIAALSALNMLPLPGVTK